MGGIKIMKQLGEKEEILSTFKHDFPISSCLPERLKDPKAMPLPLCRLCCPFHRWVESSYLTPHSAFNWHPICIAENRGGGQGDVYAVANEVAWRVHGWILAKQPPPCTHRLVPVTAAPHSQHIDECTHSKSSQILLPVTMVRSA